MRGPRKAERWREFSLWPGPSASPRAWFVEAEVAAAEKRRPNGGDLGEVGGNHGARFLVVIGPRWRSTTI